MTTEIAGEVQLRSYGSFLEEYSSQLQGIEEALEDHISDSWDITSDPIALQVTPPEIFQLYAFFLICYNFYWFLIYSFPHMRK